MASKSGAVTGPNADESDSEKPTDGIRKHRLDRHPTPGVHNSLWSWPDAKSPVIVVRNYIVIVLARIAPSLRLKNWLLRRIGVSVESGVSWGLESTPDVFWPERITVGDDAVIGYDATLLCHEFLQDEYRLGDVVVGKRAMIGAGAIVLPGVEIGDGARVAANSLVTTDVPPDVTVAGVPATVISRASVEGDGSDGSTGGEDSDSSTGSEDSDSSTGNEENSDRSTGSDDSDNSIGNEEDSDSSINDDALSEERSGVDSERETVR